jgi:pimeloyl-ACP methyl ester carboxylesterase
MAHGFGAQRDFALEPFARVFANAGMAVLLFDYRGFGDSEGLPRQWVSPRRHIQDYHSALAYVRSLADIDANKLGLWGTSFSGGHVLVVAAQDQRIQAVSSMVPFVSGPASLGRVPGKTLLQLSWAGIRDWVQAISGGPAYQLPIVGRPGELAMMSSPESYPGYMSMVPKGTSWRNETPARIALAAGLYMPFRFASQVACPTLIVAGKQDSLVPLDSIRSTAEKIPQCRLEELDCNHFAPYSGEWFEKAAEIQRQFLVQHLLA